MHRPIREQGAWLRRVVGGRVRYQGVPTNTRALSTFRFQVGRPWMRALRRRGQRHRETWARVQGHIPLTCWTASRSPLGTISLLHHVGSDDILLGPADALRSLDHTN